MAVMSNERGFPVAVEAFTKWLAENAPVLSEPFEQVLDAETKHHPQSHILYTLIMAAFDAGREYERAGAPGDS